MPCQFEDLLRPHIELELAARLLLMLSVLLLGAILDTLSQLLNAQLLLAVSRLLRGEIADLAYFAELLGE